MTPLFLFDNVACLILLRFNQGHIREVANFKAHMNVLEKLQEESRARVCQHQNESVAGKKD